jgi:D-inositol-3-phosphate glycosyltransferase
MFHTLGALKNDIGLGEEEPVLRLETERYLAQHCHHVIATTKRERDYLVRQYGAVPERLSVHPCGVNLELFQPVEKQKARQRLGLVEDKIILYIGRIEPLKGIDQLLKALPLLHDGSSLRLVIIGGDNNSQDEVEKLQSLARDLAIEDLVTFSGLVKQEELPYFYSAADVCVIPSHYESFGLVALESLACGTPVVATDVGDLKSIIRDGENGYVVRDNSPHRLAQKIALILNKSTYDIQSALLIRASVSRFSWPNIAEEIIREFQQLLAGYPALVP